LSRVKLHMLNSRHILCMLDISFLPFLILLCRIQSFPFDLPIQRSSRTYELPSTFHLDLTYRKRGSVPVRHSIFRAERGNVLDPSIPRSHNLPSASFRPGCHVYWSGYRLRCGMVPQSYAKYSNTDHERGKFCFPPLALLMLCSTGVAPNRAEMRSSEIFGGR
jgi:hypothetical protein